jgi:DNA polymerase III sliding clamp (beta) subunit (PCNA family)
MKIKDLRLALNATPKKPDIRYYLNGLNITKTHVTGTNGHMLCHINTYNNEIPDDHDNIIIPVETVKALLKKVGGKMCDNFKVGIFLINNQYQLQCMNQVEVFTPIDHKYPSFNKIIDPIKLNDHDKNLNSICHQFDWDYISLANKSLCIYFGNTTPNRLYSCIEYGYFMPSLDNDVIYVIMPTRN